MNINKINFYGNLFQLNKQVNRNKNSNTNNTTSIKDYQQARMQCPIYTLQAYSNIVKPKISFSGRIPLTIESSPNLKELLEAAREGNNIAPRVVSALFNEGTYDVTKISDSLYVQCMKIHEEIVKKLRVKTPKDISNWAEELHKELGTSKKEIYQIMLRLTQFGSYKQLKILGAELAKHGVTKFYTESGVTTNSALHYISAKKLQFSLHNPDSNIFKDGKKTMDKEISAFILDDASLHYLKHLGGNKKQEFLKQIKNGTIKLFTLDGTNLKINGKSSSYTIFDGEQDLKTITKNVIKRLQKGKKLNNIINKDYTPELSKIFGEDVPITNIKINSFINNANSVAKQIRPNMPSAKQIQQSIEAYIKYLENREPNFPRKDEKKYKNLLALYTKNIIRPVSHELLADGLKTKYNSIEKYVKSLGKTMDDVVYIYPKREKSFELINYMYSKINNVDINKFILNDGTTGKGKFNDKVVVIFDDVVGSGKSLLYKEFDYENFAKSNPNTHFVFSPITCSQNGVNNINLKINALNRQANDKLIYDDKMAVDIGDLLENLPKNDSLFLMRYLGELGKGACSLCTTFPYMIPDNCTTFSGFLLRSFLNNSNEKANKAIKDTAYSAISNYLVQ